MDFLKALLVNIFTFLAIAPFVSFILVWIIFYFIYQEKKKATQIAMDVTVVFLIIVVSAMYNDIFNSRIGFWLIVLCFLLATGFIGNAQNRLKGRLDFPKIYKIVWRVGFIVLACLYVLFMIIGIIKGLF